VCFDFLYNFCLKHFSLYEEFSEILSWTYISLHVKYSLFLPDFKETLIFSTDFPEVLKYQILWGSVQLQPSCSTQRKRRTDRRTNMTQLHWAICVSVCSISLPVEMHSFHRQYCSFYCRIFWNRPWKFLCRSPWIIVITPQWTRQLMQKTFIHKYATVTVCSADNVAADLTALRV
jgi:hypothetical protein